MKRKEIAKQGKRREKRRKKLENKQRKERDIINNISPG